MILLFSNQSNQSFRPYWRCYYANTDAIVYVIDSADKDRINTAKAELSSMLQVKIWMISCMHFQLVLFVCLGRRVKEHFIVDPG